MYNILICDDDRDIVAALKIYLTSDENRLFAAYDGAEALRIAAENELHLVLMDVMMPVKDGIAATRELRERYNMPIILLTAKSEDADKVMGLGVGADDYITKPFNPMEVLARVRSALRRYTMLGGLPKKPDTIRIGGVELDDNAKSVSVDGEKISLTPTEYGILKLMMESPGRVFSTQEIASKVSGSTYGGESAVAVHIRHLREKLEIVPSEPRYIKVVWGHGYKFEEGQK